MTATEDELSRPEFETVDLDVDVEEAQRRIQATIKGLSTAETDDVVKYRTLDGMLVAVVGSRPTESDDTEAQLAYRTAPAADLATRKAATLLDALKPHAIHR